MAYAGGAFIIFNDKTLNRQRLYCMIVVKCRNIIEVSQNGIRY